MKRGRTPLAKTIRANAATMALYASASPRNLDIEALQMATIPEIREKVKRERKPSSVPLESDVQREIIKHLLQRVDVRAVCRINSGTMQEKDRFIRMNTVYGKQNGLYMRMADIQCIHWPSGRLMAIECKRPGWKQPSSKREHEQAAYLECIRESGGIAFFATSVQDVEKGLENGTAV